MAKTKAKSKAVPAAQTVAEAADLVGRIGEIQRELARQAADLGDAVAKAKESAEERAAPLKAELAEAQARVQGFCEANRDLLTKAGRTKTIELSTGKVAWRARPASVGLRGVDKVLAYLLASAPGSLLRGFVRTKHEVDKEAMLRDPETARLVPGVTIGSEGEDFVIEPFEAELVEARA